MALSSLMMQKACARIKPGMRAASMGYPDIIAPLKEVESVLGAKFYSLKYREDSEVISRRHMQEHRKIPDAQSFFSLLGVQLDVYDVVKARGCEVIADLNEPLTTVPYPARWGYDLVLDVGTLEHCFNIAQAAINMASLVKQGGFIFHENPFNWGNHGFYGLNPTWHSDFYSVNGFRLIEYQMVDQEYNVVQNVPPTQRFIYVDREVNLFAVAQRERIQPLIYPVQTKYKKVIPAAGDFRASTGSN